MNPHGEMSEALRMAVENGHTERVVDLLKRGAPSVLDQEGQTPLHIAASAGHSELVDALIQAGCDVTVQDFTGHTALQRASAEGHLEIVKTLLENGVSVDHQDEVHGNTALHEAAWKGFSQTVQTLCKWKANAYIKNRGGFAPLHLCCQNGHNETCRVLLLAGCKPDIKNNYGDTPLHTGARYGHAGVIRILVSADCNPSEQNKNGDTALHIAAAMGRRKLTRVLLESGCNKDVRNKQNETAVEIAQRKNLHDIMQILQNFNNKNRRATGNLNNNNLLKFPEKSVDDTLTEEDFDVDAIIQDVSYNPDKRSSGSSKENYHHRRKSRKTTQGRKRHYNDPDQLMDSDSFSPYGYHPQLAELDEMFRRNPRAIKDIMDQLNPGEQFYLDLAGNVRKGPSARNRDCYCAPVFAKFEKRLEKDKKELIKHIDMSQMKLNSKIASLEKRTKEQLFGLNQSMKESFAAERGECQDRMERRALRERIAIERQQVLRDVALKRELAIWLDAKLTEIERRNNLDAKNAALLRSMAIKRLTKFKRSKNDNNGALRRAHSEELLSEVGVTDHSGSSSICQSPDKNSMDHQDLSLLQVSDHPRMRHCSADGNEENNYENFAHDLSSNGLTYLPWSPMTNTRDLANSTQGLLVNSRPSSTSMSPERRLDIVLGSASGSGSEISRFSDQNPGFKQMARPIPTFNSFGIHQDPIEAEEVHRARPAYVPTPSPGGESDQDLAPPLPARHNQPPIQAQSSSQPLPYFPFHQFPGRSVKPMLAPLDENDYSPGEDQADSIGSSGGAKSKLRLSSADHNGGDFPSLLNVPLGSDGQASHDSHNDSGYSTRFGYSAGPSPSLSGSRPESSEGDHPHYQNGNTPLLLDPMAISMIPAEYDQPIKAKKPSMIEKVTNGFSKLHLTSNNSFGPKGSLV